MKEYTCPECGAIVPVVKKEARDGLALCENCDGKFDISDAADAVSEIGPEYYSDDGYDGEEEGSNT